MASVKNEIICCKPNKNYEIYALSKHIHQQKCFIGLSIKFRDTHHKPALASFFVEEQLISFFEKSLLSSQALNKRVKRSLNKFSRNGRTIFVQNNVFTPF